MTGNAREPGKEPRVPTQPPQGELERLAAESRRRAAAIPEGFYALGIPVNRFLYERYTHAARELLEDAGFTQLQSARVLEVGCGDAKWLVQFQAWGAAQRRLYGIDLIPARIEDAAKRLPEAHLQIGDASSLPWPDGSFDVVIQSTVFTYILDEAMRRAIVGEMMRVLAPGGVVLWYDFILDPFNPNVSGIGLGRIRQLFPGLKISHRRVTLAPPIARAVVPRAEWLARILNGIPFLRSHIVATLRR